MKKLKIYLDTSVISYLLQPDAPEEIISDTHKGAEVVLVQLKNKNRTETERDV